LNRGDIGGEDAIVERVVVVAEDVDLGDGKVGAVYTVGAVNAEFLWAFSSVSKSNEGKGEGKGANRVS
jgi:hypothetical protein